MDDVIMEKDDENNTNVSEIARFRNFLKLNEISGITINSIKSTNVMYINSNSECTQFNVNFTLPLELHVDMKIAYPRTALFSKDAVDVSKLRISINDTDVKREIISCTNYLQRQRNANLALSILKKCATLITERKLIIDMLNLHCEGCITNEPHEDGGVIIECKDRNTNFRFFESLWKIKFDCTSHRVTDFIDFSITRQDRMFHDAAKIAMNRLINPSLSYKNKVELWWNIIQAANTSIDQEILVVKPWEAKDFLSVRSIQEINSEDCEQYEILESDDENCIVIDDD